MKKKFKKIQNRFLLSLLLGCLISSHVLAIQVEGIPLDAVGHITFAKKNNWEMLVRNSDGSVRSVDSKTILRQSDRIVTITGQQILALLEDGTEIFLGPNSHLEITNWFYRGSDKKLIRTLTLKRGVLKAKVRKVYSELEPFIVKSQYGVVAVRGTEFVVEVGSAGRLERARRLSKQELELRRHEMEVHTLEGEVYFAKKLEDIRIPNRRVSLNAGETTNLYLGLWRPQPVHRFDLKKYRTYLAQAVPTVPVLVNKKTNNENRAIQASNVRQVGADEVSPAHPAYADLDRLAQASGRLPATSDVSSKISRIRRKRFIANKSEKHEELISQTPKRKKVASDGLNDAFSGGEASSAALNRGSLSSASTQRVFQQGSQGLFRGTTSEQSMSKWSGPPPKDPVKQLH